MKSLLLISAFFMIGCGSWLVRQDCKQVDWYNYGHSVAMQGRRLSGDTQVKRCQDADFEVPYQQLDAGFKEGMNKYCQPQVVYSIGKSGEFFNPELCDPSQARMLQEQHKKGIEAYCTVDNGYTAGASGKKYQNICPSKLETGFLKEYRRGRRAYLTGKMTEADSNVINIERQMLDLERQRNNVSWRLNAIPAGTHFAKPDDDPYRNERDRLGMDLRSLDSQIDRKQREKETWVKNKGEYQAEIATLQE